MCEGGISLLGGKSTERMWRRKLKTNLADFKNLQWGASNKCQGLSWAGYRNYSQPVLRKDPPSGGVYDSHFLDEETAAQGHSRSECWDLNTRSLHLGPGLWSQARACAVCVASSLIFPSALLSIPINPCLLCDKSSLSLSDFLVCSFFKCLVRILRNIKESYKAQEWHKSHLHFSFSGEVFATLSSWPWYRVLNLWMSWVLLDILWSS